MEENARATTTVTRIQNSLKIQMIGRLFKAIADFSPCIFEVTEFQPAFKTIIARRLFDPNFILLEA